MSPSPPRAEDTQMHTGDRKPDHEMREVRPEVTPVTLHQIEGHIREGATSPQQPERPPRERRAPDPNREPGRGEREREQQLRSDPRDPREVTRRDTAPLLNPHRREEGEGEDDGKAPQRPREAEDVALPLEETFDRTSEPDDYDMAEFEQAHVEEQQRLEKQAAEQQVNKLLRRSNPAVSGPRARQQAPERPHAQSNTFGYIVNGSFWTRETPKMSNSQIDELIHSHRQMVEHQRYSQQHADKLSSMVTRLEAELKQVREDLGASRAFVASETSVDARDLLQKLTDINEAADDLVFNMLQYSEEGISLESELETVLTEPMAKAVLGAVDPTEVKILTPFSQYACITGMTVGQYIQPVAQSLLLHFLMGYVFVPFIPGLSPEENRPIERLYKHVTAAEPQDRAARWRAITYTRAYPKRNDTLIAETCARAFLIALNKVFYHLIPALQAKSPDPTDVAWMESFEPTVQVIVQDAIKWQDRTKTSHLSYDYAVTFFPEGPFESWSMVVAEDDNEGGGKKKGGREKDLAVILCVGLGIQALKSVTESDGKTIQRELRYMVPSKVIAVRAPK